MQCWQKPMALLGLKLLSKKPQLWLILEIFHPHWFPYKRGNLANKKGNLAYRRQKAAAVVAGQMLWNVKMIPFKTFDITAETGTNKQGGGGRVWEIYHMQNSSLVTIHDPTLNGIVREILLLWRVVLGCTLWVTLDAITVWKNMQKIERWRKKEIDKLNLNSTGWKA